MKVIVRAAMAAVLVLCSLGVLLDVTLAQGNVEGTVYTSPHFDYQLQWSSPWYFIEEGSEAGGDYLDISDGASYVRFSFFYYPSVDASQFAEEFKNGGSEAGFSNVQPLRDAQGVVVAGGDATHAWDGVSATTQLDDGSSVDITLYFDVRILPGGVVLVMTASAPSYFYDDTVLQGWKQLADTALVISGPTPTPVETPVTPVETPVTPVETPVTPVETPVTPVQTVDIPPPQTAVPEVSETPPAIGVGEPAPAFAAGPWRIAVRAVDLGESIDYLGLGFVEGNQWIVVYADVTNWSDTDAELDTASMTLATDGGLVAPSAADTQATAATLGLEPFNGSSVLVPAGSSVRVALVYSIPVAQTELTLAMDDTQLSLSDAVGRQLDVTDLSNLATPPAVQEGAVQEGGTVGMVSLDGAVQLFVDGTLVQVAGVELPSDTDCADEQSAVLLAVGSLSGKTVWLESDSAITESDSYYVWYEDDSGNRVLLNQGLVADGAAAEGDLPDAARFGAWIEQSETIAQANGTGIWGSCTG